MSCAVRNSAESLVNVTNRNAEVNALIACRRYETLSLHNILQGFSTLDCDWLIPNDRRARKQTRVTFSDNLKRRELLEEFLYWYFDSFVMPLLKVCIFGVRNAAIIDLDRVDHVLHHRIVSLPQSGPVFPSR
jgi:hypothetical protein